MIFVASKISSTKQCSGLVVVDELQYANISTKAQRTLCGGTPRANVATMVCSERIEVECKGRSSWRSEEMCTISTARTTCIAADSSPLTSLQATRQSTGLTRFPPENNRYCYTLQILRWSLQREMTSPTAIQTFSFGSSSWDRRQQSNPVLPETEHTPRNHKTLLRDSAQDQRHPLCLFFQF